MLAAQYDLAEPLSERLENLLKHFENSDKRSAVDTRGTPSYRARTKKYAAPVGAALGVIEVEPVQ
jgi:hypothetical protein